MTKTQKFWVSVRELAAMRSNIPAERREMSGVRAAIRMDVRPEIGNSSSNSDQPEATVTPIYRWPSPPDSKIS